MILLETGPGWARTELRHECPKAHVPHFVSSEFLNFSPSIASTGYIQFAVTLKVPSSRRYGSSHASSELRNARPMKFARELVEEQVPEWRAKYLDYKQSKRRIKAVSVAAARYATTSQNGPFKRHSQHTTISSPTITPLLCEISPPATRPHSVDGSRPAPLPPHSVFFPENTHHGPKNTCQSPARSKLTRGRSFNGTLRSHFTGPQVIEGLRSTLEQRQHEFFAFLTTEFEKISLFYKERENEATSRLEALRRQLQFFHDQKEDKAKARAGGGTSGEPSDQSVQDHHGLSIIYHPLDAARSLRFRSRTSNTESTGQFRSKDYVPRPYPPSVKFSAARRKLKRGMRDYYRYLEYVRSYGLMNRLAFRKANKKYDKVVKAHPRLEFVSTFVDNAYFVKSDVIDSLMSETEDLYAEHFEDGNRKVAVSKLKKKAAQDAAHNGSVFRNGLLLGIGLVFGVQGLISAAHIIIDGYDATLSQQTSLLLQVWPNSKSMESLELTVLVIRWLLSNIVSHLFLLSRL